MTEMLPFGLTKHQYLIEIYHYKLSKEWLEDLIHKPHKHARGVSEAKWHDYPHVESNLGLEHGLPLISLFIPDLVVPTS